jgi:uncharacterized protein YndB with AHSA1/START domain
MAISTCPAANVAAPVEEVWVLLADPARYDEWWDAHLERMEPVGPAVEGQRAEASTGAFGRRFTISFEVLQVDAEKHKIQMDVNQPFGIMEHTTISCTPIDEQSCRVQFG